MAEVPGSRWTAREDGATDLSAAPFPADWKPAGVVTHVFTHFELRLSVHVAETEGKAIDHGFWRKIENLDREALPTVMKKAIEAAIPGAF